MYGTPRDEWEDGGPSRTSPKKTYPHVQRRFYDEYRAWQATDAAFGRVPMLANEGFQELLAAKDMPDLMRLNREARSLQEPRER